jgi:branched-chain amino acid transport system ATP-binding protein
MEAVVELRGVSKSFGSLKVIDNLDLRVAEGEALGIVGPNGAGKTTMLNLIAGNLRPDAGEILFRGRDITRVPSHRLSGMGIARTFQIPRPFGGMTVFENALVGASHRQTHSGTSVEETVIVALETAALTAKANSLAGSLTLLERKRLELARALATSPQVLLLDEVAGGLAEHEVHELVATIQEVRSRGVAVVWIEHVVHALLRVIDRLVALDFGRKVMEGDPRTVMASPEVRDVYLGADAP